MDSSGNLHDDWSVRDTLTQRFGAATKDSLIDAYQDAWLQESDFDNIAALGMNCVRLPFWYLNVQEEDGTWRADAFDRMDWAVSNAWERGIYTIIDLHGAPGGQRANADTTGRNWPTAALWTSTNYQNRTLEIWQKVSQHYNGNPAVAGYDLLNEPMDTPNSATYWSFMDSCYQTVRANDPDHIIIMEATYGQWNLSMLPDPALYGWSNVVYQLHHYPWDYWNDVNLINASADAKVQDWVNHSSWNVPCQMGEFGMGPEAAWKYSVETYSDSGMSWMMWAYKSTFTGGTTSWGVYNPNGSVTAVPNIQNNTSSSISNQWSQWTTAGGFSLNQSHRRTLSMPVANDDAYTLGSGNVLAVSAGGVLDNDTHMNLGGAGIQLETVKMSEPANGSVVLNSDGSFTYTANGGFQGTDTFRYKVWDGRIDSVRNATVSINVMTNTVAGPATQLIWATQPGQATNGLPFAQQPVLITADQYGVPSSNGLPAVLDVNVTLTSGTGPLLGTTNFNIGTGGFNGVVPFADLQIDSIGSDKELTASTSATTNILSINSLLNSDFNAPNSTAPADNWTSWTTGGGWANHENAVGVTYDDSYYMVCGGFANETGGFYQTVSAVAGGTYGFSVLSGADAWWLPYGEMRLYFLNAVGEQVGYSFRSTVDPATYGYQYDVPHPWQSYTHYATAPSGTTQVKVELMSTGSGSVWFENAELSGQVSMPVLSSAVTLPFTVHEYVPTSQTNHITGIAISGAGIYTLDVVGAVGVSYSVETATNLSSPVIWDAVAGSTHTVTNTSGLWSYTGTNSSPQLFFRSKVVTP